jgi:hypothetical protein
MKSVMVMMSCQNIVRSFITLMADARFRVEVFESCTAERILTSGKLVEATKLLPIHFIQWQDFPCSRPTWVVRSVQLAAQLTPVAAF